MKKIIYHLNTRRFAMAIASLIMIAMTITTLSSCGDNDEPSPQQNTREIELFIGVGGTLIQGTSYPNYSEFSKTVDRLVKEANAQIGKTYQVKTSLSPNDIQSEACIAFNKQVAAEHYNDIKAAAKVAEALAEALNAEADKIRPNLTDNEKAVDYVVDLSVEMTYSNYSYLIMGSIVYEEGYWKIVLNQK